MEEKVLLEVMTTADITRIYNIPRKRVEDARNTRHRPLVGRKDGNVWIYTKASVERRFGKLPVPLESIED